MMGYTQDATTSGTEPLKTYLPRTYRASPDTAAAAVDACTFRSTGSTVAPSPQLGPDHDQGAPPDACAHCQHGGQVVPGEPDLGDVQPGEPVQDARHVERQQPPVHHDEAPADRRARQLRVQDHHEDEERE